MNWKSLDEAFAVRENGVVEADLTLFGKLAEAVLKQNEVIFRYRKSGAKESSNRRLHPYHVGEISGGWYVIGFDQDRMGLRTFALQRIVGLQVTNTNFEKPDDFSIGSYLGGSIGVWSNEASAEPVEVVLEVTGWVARMVQERLWHETQRIQVLDDYGERVELRMQLTSFEEFASIVLSWGRNAKVISPPEFVKKVKGELEAASELYK
jgi:proteasome accessory factor B